MYDHTLETWVACKLGGSLNTFGIYSNRDFQSSSPHIFDNTYQVWLAHFHVLLFFHLSLYLVLPHISHEVFLHSTTWSLNSSFVNLASYRGDSISLRCFAYLSITTQYSWMSALVSWNTLSNHFHAAVQHYQTSRTETKTNTLHFMAKNIIFFHLNIIILNKDIFSEANLRNNDKSS